MKLSDETIQQIVDDHAPSQGDPWDMAAMLRKAYALGMERMREAAAKACEEQDAGRSRLTGYATGNACAEAIRALPVE